MVQRSRGIGETATPRDISLIQNHRVVIFMHELYGMGGELMIRFDLDSFEV